MRIVLYTLLIILFSFKQAPILQAQWTQTQCPSGGNITALITIDSHIIAAAIVGGIYYSTNSGTSWNTENTGLTNTGVWSLIISGTNMFAGTNGGGVFLSTNNGTSWNPVNTGLANKNVLALAFHGAKIFAGTDAGVYLSTNNGTTWTAVNSGLTNTNVQALLSSDTNLFAGTMGGVFLSTNNGTNWSSANTGLPAAFFRGAFVSSGSTIFAGSPLSGGGAFISTNNGANWQKVNAGLTNIEIFSLYCQGSKLYAGSGNGVFLSTNNGTSWNIVSSGLPANDNVLSITSIGNTLLAGTEHFGVFKLDTVFTGVAQNQIPLQFMLGQNYPNPFNPSTTISFTIPSQSFVSLKVFDALGREVSTLVFKGLSAGKYSQQWNAEKFASGMYFYRLQTGSFTETKKLVLLR